MQQGPRGRHSWQIGQRSRRWQQRQRTMARRQGVRLRQLLPMASMQLLLQVGPSLLILLRPRPVPPLLVLLLPPAILSLLLCVLSPERHSLPRLRLLVLSRPLLAPGEGVAEETRQMPSPEQRPQEADEEAE